MVEWIERRIISIFKSYLMLDDGCLQTFVDFFVGFVGTCVCACVFSVHAYINTHGVDFVNPI